MTTFGVSVRQDMAMGVDGQFDAQRWSDLFVKAERLGYEQAFAADHIFVPRRSSRSSAALRSGEDLDGRTLPTSGTTPSKLREGIQQIQALADEAGRDLSDLLTLEFSPVA